MVVSIMLNLSKQQFDRLIVLHKNGRNKQNKILWLCNCKCGSIVSICTGDLRAGRTKSCGCLQKELLSIKSTKHGHKKYGKVSKIYSVWITMIQRCTNIKNKNYPRYGGRDIRVCKRWMLFENFIEDMGHPPHNHQIDRIYNNGNYCKSNCRWTTSKNNNRNRQNNRLISHNGKIQCISAWAEEMQINYQTLIGRLNRGWSIKKALLS